MTEEDIQTQLKLKLGFESSKIWQQHESMVSIAAAIFGKSSNTVKPAETYEQAVSQFKSVFGG